MDWFYAKHGKQEGPVSLEVLRGKFQSGEVAETDLIWREGMPEWVAASTVPEVAARQEDSAAPTGGGLPGLGAPASPQGVTGEQAVSQPASGLATGVARSTPGLATASLICGILAIVLSCCGIGFFCGIGAVICGHMQMGQYKAHPEDETGKGLVTAGLITGYIGIALSLLIIVLQVIRGLDDLGHI